MKKQKYHFETDGPSFLTNIDWNNRHHRRIICASLVNGVNVLEHKRGSHTTYAPSAWWEFFNFKVTEILVDDYDSSYFGVVYEFDYNSLYIGQTPPKYVIAFRGTKMAASNIMRDLKLDICCFFNNLHKTKRVKKAIETTEEIVKRTSNPGEVWLAGHSLGSAVALITGKHMVKECGVHMETYLFNPVMISVPTDHLVKSKATKFMMRLVHGALTSAVYFSVVHVGNIKQDEENETFKKLSSWIPHLFLNPSDAICAEYISHFEYLKTGVGRFLGNITAKHSIRSLISAGFGNTDHNAYHLIPSANLTINSSESARNENHELYQWWCRSDDSKFRSKLYKYNITSGGFDQLG